MGKISELNLWDYFMGDSEIIHMSYGCGDHHGNVLSWIRIGQTAKGTFERQNSSVSIEHQGGCFVKLRGTLSYYVCIGNHTVSSEFF